jgi:hypothetical protein
MKIDELRQEELKLGPLAARGTLICGAVALVGLLATVAVGLTVDHGAERFFRSYLVNFMFFLSLGLGALFFVLVSHLVRAGWGVVVRRLAEAMAATLAPMALLGGVLLFGLHELYEWTHAEVVAHDTLLQHKSPYLNTPFFVGRLIFYFVIWNLIAWYFRGRSLRQDRTRDPGLTVEMERVAAPAMIFYAMTVTFAAFDLMMSLYPHWYSTIYGVYFFAGTVLSFFSLVPLMVFVLQRRGKLTEVVGIAHYHDMGKLMFAFVVFWAYIAFSQFMLFWMGNLPEETIWYEVRQGGGWASVSLLLLLGHFVVPFFWLLSRHFKIRPRLLIVAAVWLLIVHWVDLYYLVMPETNPAGPPLQLLDLTCFLFVGGVVGAAACTLLGRGHLIPVGDPRLQESLELHNA